jgi:hypothetical protein
MVKPMVAMIAQKFSPHQMGQQWTLSDLVDDFRNFFWIWYVSHFQLHRRKYRHLSALAKNEQSLKLTQ